MEGHFMEEMDILDYDSRNMGQEGALCDVSMDSVNDHFASQSCSSADRNDHQPVVIDSGSFDPSLDYDAMSEAASSQDFPMDDDEESKDSLSYELQIGYRILKEVMSDSNKSVNWPFMDPIDTEKLDLWDYYKRIQKPMWLKKIEEKFHRREYDTITEFVSDVRLMLENCYRYNGPDHYISKRGQKLEMILEQKLALLSRELREKTSIAATSGQPVEETVISGTRRRKVLVPHDSTALLNQLRMEEKEREKEQRRQQMFEKQKEREAYLAELQEWEDSLYPTPWKKYMNAMWEVPQIGHFLFLCSLHLNIGEVVHWELERGFLLPRESSTFQTVMTSLISTPYQRTRLDKKPLMPYKVWEDRVRIRIRQWYKVLSDFKGDRARAAYKLGIDDTFFKTVGLMSPLEKKKFHELTFYQRIWIVKSLCDWCLENQESIREAIEANVLEDQKTYSLGFDAEGYEYIHFPQFCGADLRIYKQAPFKMPKLDMPPADNSNKKQKRRGPKKLPRKRDGRLRQNPRTSSASAANNDSFDDSSGASDDSGISGSESEEDPEPKVPRYNRAAVTRNKLLDVDSDVSREGTPTRLTRSRVSNASKTPSRESTPQRSGRRRGEASNTPEPSLYQRRSLRRLGIDATEMASIYYPVATPESSGSKSPARTGEDEEDKESNASDVKTPASKRTQDRNRKGRSRTQSRKSTRKKKSESDNDEEETESMEVSEAKDENNDGDEMGEDKPFSSYMTNDKSSDEPNDSKDGPPSGKISPSNCDTKSVHSECPSEPATFIDSEWSNSVRSTPVSGMLNNTETDKDKSAITTDNHVSEISEQTEEQHCQDVGKKGPQNSSDSTLESKSIDDDLRESKCDEIESCDGKDVKAVDETQSDSKNGKMSDTQSAIEPGTSNINTKLTDEVKSEGCESNPNAMGDGPSVKTEDIKAGVPSEGGDQLVKSENAETETEEGGSSVKVEEKKEDAESSEMKMENGDGIREENAENKEDKNGTIHAEVDPEMKEPVVGEFELIVECVEDLRNLVLKFAPPEPVTEVKGTREKVIKPIPRKKCEVDLYKRLQCLLEELEPWEQKLIAANKRARLKMRREHAGYKEDPEPQVDNVWESEESNSEDSTSEDEETRTNRKDEKEKEKKKVSAAEGVAEYSKPPTPDLEVSSRGRIRKRRVIPDAAEDDSSDTGSPMNQSRNAKRRKKDSASPVPTTSQEMPVTSGVPSHSTIQSVINQLAATNQLPSNGISVLNINNQMVLVSPGQKPVIIQTSQPLNNLSMSNLNLLAQLTGLVKPVTVSAATSTSCVSSVSQSPVRGSATANILRQASPKPAGSQSLISAIKPGQLTAQQVLMMKKQQQLRQQAAATGNKLEVKTTPIAESSTTRIVTVMPTATPKSVAAGNTPEKSEVASTAAASTKPQYVAYNNLHQMAPQVVKQLIQAQMKGGAVKSAVISAGQNTNGDNAGKVVQVVSPVTGNTSGNVSLTAASSPQNISLQGQLASKLVSPSAAKTTLNVVTSQPQPVIQKQPVGLSPRSNNNTLKQANPGLLRALSSPPKPKYAGNVTVKSLLESRAAQMKADTSTPLQYVSSVASAAKVQDFDVSLENEGEAQISSTILDPERQNRLNEVIKTVLTEIQTSVPTATLKVASPFMVSGVKSNRSITVVSSAMKSPIPALSQITPQSSPSYGVKTAYASDASVAITTGGSSAANVFKKVQGQGAGQKLVLPVQLKPPSQALMGLTPRTMGKAAVTSADVGNVQAVVSNTALLQQQLNLNAAQGTVGMSTQGASVPASVLQPLSSVTQSATAKLQQAITQVTTPPPKAAALKIHSISVQGSSATLQLTGVHGVAPGKAVQLKLTIPPGLTIHQLLQSPQLQQHLANLQSSGLSAATKTLAVQRTVAQNTAATVANALTQQAVVQQKAAPGSQVMMQKTTAQTANLVSPSGISSRGDLQLTNVQSAPQSQIIGAQGDTRAIVLQKGQVPLPQTASSAGQMSPARIVGDKIATAQIAMQQSGQQTQVIKTTPQVAQKLLMQVGKQQQNTQTVSAQQVITQKASSIQQCTSTARNFTPVGLKTTAVKQELQKPQATIKQITQSHLPKPVSQSPQKAQVGSSTKSQTVQQLLEAAQRRAASQNPGASAQGSTTMPSTSLQGVSLQQHAPVQAVTKVVTQGAPKAVVTSPLTSLTSSSKLVLVNMNGQLMTTSGLPVTVSQGMLKFMPGTQSVAASSGVVQLPAQIPAQQVVTLAPQQPQQQILMLPQQTLASPVKIAASQSTSANLTAQQLLAVQQAQVQQQLKQAQVQASQVQAQLQPVQVQPQLQQRNVVQSSVQSSPVAGIKVGGVAGTLVQTTQAQSTITLPASAVSQTSGVAHIRMPVGTVIVPPNETSRPATANPTNLTAVRLADGRYVLQLPAGSAGTSKLVLPTSSTLTHLPNGDSS